ncbi:hypothetical protein GALMADRAFT_102723 [Galerina marginata CBS 339.88]|uniref:F-box domain-containing protein n=1 Tax=Galerina marginata (strain CBS 339.88) TaxID=685588 RepID=A0A067SKG2_GALM3|nr:hypothetical protein GALMADRAFT_102723 [Galerina marginata CBS 339.88]
MSLDSLPQEIQIEILAHLDYRSLLRSASTCRSLYQTCKGSLQVQYIIELAMNGMNDSGSNIPHAELLSRLRDLRGAWEVLAWKRVKKVLIGDDCLAYELVAGVFALSNGDGLMFNWLPSATVDGRTLERRSLELTVRDFAMDPTQDLIAILEDDQIPISFHHGRNVRVHIKTISTNEYHPASRQGILAFQILPDQDYGNGIQNAMLQVAYDTVALFVTKAGLPFKSRILIWNWCNGTLVYDSDQVECGGSLPTDIHDFSLLNRNSFVLTSVRDAGVILVYSFLPSAISLTPPRLAVALHFPAICTAYRVVKLSIHSGPIHANSPDDSLFFTSPESHIQVFTVVYTSSDQRGHRPISYWLFVHDRTLLEYIERSKSSPRGATDTELDVEWGSWGEMNTRFFPSRSPVHWLRYVHGQRVVCSSTENEYVDVLDFNFHTTLRSTTSGYTPQRYPISEPSSIYPQYLFQHNFVTRLPYQVSTRTIGERFYASMIDEERLIGLKMERDIMELHVYSF